MNKNYDQLSFYYDEIMHVMNYKEMYDFTKKYLKKESSILDLACGSGTLAILLKINGYDIEGLDISSTMIEVAIEKNKINHTDISFHIADMINFNLNKKYDVITCFFDSINMLDNISKIHQMFENIYNNLNENGIFIFDIFSYSKYLECKRLRFKEDLIWFKYDWKLNITKPNKLIHNIKIKEGSKKINEIYNEYFYDFNDLIDLNKFNILKVSGDFKDSYHIDDERVVVVLQKKGN